MSISSTLKHLALKLTYYTFSVILLRFERFEIL